MDGKGLFIESLRQRNDYYFKKSAEWQSDFYTTFTKFQPTIPYTGQPNGTHFTDIAGRDHQHYSDDQITSFAAHLGAKWIAVRCSDGYPAHTDVLKQFTKDLVDQGHAHGLKVLGWVVADGSDDATSATRMAHIDMETSAAAAVLGSGYNADGIVVVPRWWDENPASLVTGYYSANMVAPYNGTTSAREYARSLATRANASTSTPFIAYMPFVDPPSTDSTALQRVALFDSEMISGFDAVLTTTKISMAPRILWYGGYDQDNFKDNMKTFKKYYNDNFTTAFQNRKVLMVGQSERLTSGTPHPGHGKQKDKSDKNASYVCDLAKELLTTGGAGHDFEFKGLGIYHLDGMLTKDLLEYTCLPGDFNSSSPKNPCLGCDNKISDYIKDNTEEAAFYDLFKREFPGSRDWWHRTADGDDCIP